MRNANYQMTGTKQKIANSAPFSPPPDRFGAVYDQYAFAGMSGDAIIANVGKPWRFVFWEKASNIPWWHLDDASAFTYEFFETWGKGTVGCCEPMSDRENRYSRARILQTHPARCLIHWRYALCDANYKIYDDRTWVDEVFAFYPDGYGVRQGTIHPVAPIEKHEVMEFILINAAGAPPAERMSPTALTLFNTRQERRDVTWPRGPFPNEADDWEDIIYRVNMTKGPCPFVILTQRGGNGFPGNGIRHVPWTLGQDGHWADGLFLSFNHWPIETEPLNGRGYILARDFIKASHTSLISFHNRNTTDSDAAWLFLIGCLAEGDGETRLLELAESWIKGGAVKSGQGAPYLGYSPADRAYVFDGRQYEHAEFVFKPAGRVVLNPVFIFKGIPRERVLKGVQVEGDGVKLDPRYVRCGAEYRLKDYDTVVWLNARVEREQSFRFIMESCAPRM